jgi:hypothetical protein
MPAVVFALIPLIKNDSRHPKTPPTTARSNPSSTNAINTALRAKPSARSVPTSLARFATTEYMVFMAAKIAPIPSLLQRQRPSLAGIRLAGQRLNDNGSTARLHWPPTPVSSSRLRLVASKRLEFHARRKQPNVSESRKNV